MNTYRRGIVAGFAVLALVAGPFSVGAISVSDLQAQVQSLLAQIAMLQGSSPVSLPSSAPSSSYRACYVVNRNLGLGSRGDDVRSLQELLQSNGYLTAAATSYFGPLTAQAVSRWQSSQGVSAVGAFGPQSRARLAVWCGNQTTPPVDSMRFEANPSSGAAPLAVTFNTWLSGFRMASTYYTIDFGDGATERAADCNAPADACISPGQNVHTYALNGSYTASLNRITDPCAGNTACRAPIQSEVVAKTQVTAGAGTTTCKPINYMAIACSDGSAAQPRHNESGCIVGYECPVANYAPPASCKAWNDGCNECGRQAPGSPAACTQRACFAAGKGYCSVYFDTATPSNRPPVVSNFSGPTSLSVNQSGTWSVTASDPENGSLSYQITWGDENFSGNGSALSLSIPAVSQSSTLTHGYAYPGTYTVSFVVTDNAGLQARTSTTVQVGSGTVCTEQYQPVCGRPSGCANTCAPGMYCMMQCQLYPVQTFGNRCQLDAAGAQYLYSGACIPGTPQY